MQATAVPRLSRRLEHIARLVLRGRPMADIGTDHAWLPIALVERGWVPRAIASDLNAHPADSARARVELRGLSDRVAVRQGPGTSTLVAGEAATIVIGGMGGGRIAEIIEQSRPLEPQRIVAQANGGIEGLRRRATRAGLQLQDEWLFEDRGRWTSILLWGPGARPEPACAPVATNPVEPDCAGTSPDLVELPPEDYDPQRHAPAVPGPENWSGADWALGPHLRARANACFQRWLAVELRMSEARLHASRTRAARPEGLVRLEGRRALLRAELGRIATNTRLPSLTK